EYVHFQLLAFIVAERGEDLADVFLRDFQLDLPMAVGEADVQQWIGRLHFLTQTFLEVRIQDSPQRRLAALLHAWRELGRPHPKITEPGRVRIGALDEGVAFPHLSVARRPLRGAIGVEFDMLRPRRGWEL